MAKLNYFGCYDYNEEVYLLELLLDIDAREIQWTEFFTPEADLPKSNWQAPYMEQYLNREGTEKICATYGIPPSEIGFSRVAFFLYKTDAQVLHTPYGEIPLKVTSPLPKRLKDVIEFEDYSSPI